MEKICKVLVLVLVLLGANNQVKAQVTVEIDEAIEEQLRMKNAQIDTTKIQGFRIQIAFSSNMSSAEGSKSKFANKFPEISDRAYMLYQQPYWKVRIGDFKREIDAQKLLNEIRVYFPDAFVVRDYIKKPML
jgi:hypothetical protein